MADNPVDEYRTEGDSETTNRGQTAADRPPGAVASAEDFAHQRDQQGDLLGVWEEVPGMGQECAKCQGTGETPDNETVSFEAPEEIRNEILDGVEDIETCPECGGSGEVPTCIKVKPITQGEANRYLPESGDPRQLDDDEMLTLIKEFVIEPDFSHIRSIDDFKAFGLDPLVFTIMQASGFDMASGLVMENDDLVEAIQGNSKTGN